MKEIREYGISTDNQPRDIIMPEGSEILTVYVRHGSPTLLALVDPIAKKIVRRFHAVGTGAEIAPQTEHYVGSFQLYGGAFMFHLIETKQEAQ